jgi:hypothetical protein
MQGDIVKAAKWLGGCMVVASLILVIGLHPSVTGRTVTFTKVQPEAPQSPSVPASSVPAAYSATGFAGFAAPQASPSPVSFTTEPDPAGGVPKN